jgi:hypothetical protein
MRAKIFRILASTTFECACCDQFTGVAVYREGAFMCLPCAGGSHHHAGWGKKAA